MINASMPPAIAALAALTDAPGYVASAAELERARSVRAAQRKLRAFVEGDWRTPLLDEAVSQHHWPKNLRIGGKLGELVVKLNIVQLGVDMHAAVLFGHEPVINVEDDNALQIDWISAMKRAGSFATFCMEVGETIYGEGECFARPEAKSYHGADGQRRMVYTPCLESNERCFGLGTIDPHNQYSVVERRWIIARPDPMDARKTIKYLRVERHRAIDDGTGTGTVVGIVEQEAYAERRGAMAWNQRGASIGHDPLIDLTQLARVPLERAIGDGTVPSAIRLNGTDRPGIVRFVISARQGMARTLINPKDLDILDALTAAISRVVRTHQNHAEPMLRVSESMVDAQTGQVDLTKKTIIDPHAEVGYVTLDAKLTEMLDLADRMLSWALVACRVAQALIGYKPGGGAVPDTADKMRIESTNTLALAQRTHKYVEPAMERLVDLAAAMQAAQPLEGWAVSPVNITIRPELPKDPATLVQEMGERKALGLIDQLTALERLYEESEAQRIYERMLEDAERQRASDPMFGPIGFNPTNAEQGATQGEAGEAA